MLGHLRPSDTVVIWRLDRLGRSLRHLIDLVADLEQRGVGFRSLTESIDTSTPGGKLIFHVFGALAEFEQELIRERTQAGLAAARARGRVGGRPTVWTPEKLQTARAMHDSGEHDVSSIARALGVSRASVYRGLGSLPGRYWHVCAPRRRDVLCRGWLGEVCEPQDVRVECDDLLGSAGKGSPVVDGGSEVPS